MRELLARHAPKTLLLARPLTRRERALREEHLDDADANAAAHLVGAEEARLRRVAGAPPSAPAIATRRCR